MTREFFELWVYLAATPLAGLTLTLVAYAAGWWIYARCRMHPIANPVLIAVVIIVAALVATRTSYETYFAGAQFVHFLLGPAVVGLAVPLAQQWSQVRKLAVPIAGALAAGMAVAVVSVVATAKLLGASPMTILSIAPKSVTAPIAMGIAQKLGGLPALAAVFAVATGILGASIGKYVFNASRVADMRARGFALGLAAHGIGTARAFQVDSEAGAFASLAFALHGLVAAIVFPLAYLALMMR
jgi:predicted murein hydrolase (TIGR00659 family)